VFRYIWFGVLSFLLTSAVLADGWAGAASVTCGDSAPGMSNTGSPPVLNVGYALGSDARMQGLFGVAIMLADMSKGVVLTESGWDTYKGGLFPFASRYDNGFPAQIQRQIPFPGGGMTTSEFQGFGVFLGHGVYTPEAKKKVNDARDSLARNKELLVKMGKWNAQMESAQGRDHELRHIWSLIQKDAVDNKKFSQVFTIPFIDCTPFGGN
jgi:hypothetical protein